MIVIALLLVPAGMAFARSGTALLPAMSPDGRLGLCDILPGSPVPGSGPTWAQLAVNAGARLNRWEFRMDKLEPSHGTFNFSDTDTVVSNDTASGLDTEGILIGTPGWAVRPGAKPGNGVPRGLSLPITDPDNVWADFVRQTVRHYAGQVAYWEVWNEPDLSFFWSGSAVDYFNLLKVTYTVIRSVDPNARVVMAGMVVPDLGFFNSVLNAAQADSGGAAAHGYFDIAAWHAYGPAKSEYTDLLHLQSILRAHGYGDAPVWVTEAGFPASNPNGEPRQAAFVMQSIAYAYAAGADRFLVYRASDDALPTTWGLVSALGIPRLAYTTFATAAQYLSHVQSVAYDPKPDVEQFAFFTPQYRISMLWTHGATGDTVSLPAGFAAAQRVDWQGAVTSLAAIHGLIQLALPGATYNKVPDPAGTVVGGPPVMLVEDNVRPPDLSNAGYIPLSAGADRQLLLFNPGTSPRSVEVSVPSGAWQRMELRLAPHAVQIVDLDALAGPSYVGLLHVSSGGSVVAGAFSDGTATGPVTPSRAWQLPNAPDAFVITNPTRSTVTVDTTAYGYAGKTLTRSSVDVPPLQTVRWQQPAAIANRDVSLSVDANNGIMLSGDNGAALDAAPSPQNSWFSTAPGSPRLVLFNPNAASPTRVTARFIGQNAVQSTQLTIKPHRSYALPVHRARAVIVSSTGALAVGRAESTGLYPGLSTAATPTATVTAGGPVLGASLFNPSSQTARVSVSIVGRVDNFNSTRTIPPHGQITVLARKSSEPARILTLTSNVPIVTVPTA